MTTVPYVLQRLRKQPRFVDDAPQFVEWQAIHQAADSNLSPFRRAFLAYVKNLRASLDMGALARTDPDLMVGKIPFPQLRESFDNAITPVVEKTLMAGAAASAPFFERQIRHEIQVRKQFGFSFTASNPHAVRFARLHAGDLITGLSIESQRAVRLLIARAVAGRASLSEVARRIERFIGLNTRQMTAVENARAAWTAQGIASREIERRARQLGDRFLQQRALDIARTETIWAANAGQQALWQAAIDEGVLPANTERRWIVTPDDRLCPFCRSMAGQVMPMQSNFRGGTVARIIGAGVRTSPNVLHPPLHPRCRCAVRLVFRR